MRCTSLLYVERAGAASNLAAEAFRIGFSRSNPSRMSKHMREEHNALALSEPRKFIPPAAAVGRVPSPWATPSHRNDRVVHSTDRIIPQEFVATYLNIAQCSRSVATPDRSRNFASRSEHHSSCCQAPRKRPFHPLQSTAGRCRFVSKRRVWMSPRNQSPLVPHPRAPLCPRSTLQQHNRTHHKPQVHRNTHSHPH